MLVCIAIGECCYDRMALITHEAIRGSILQSVATNVQRKISRFND